MLLIGTIHWHKICACGGLALSSSPTPTQLIFTPLFYEAGNETGEREQETIWFEAKSRNKENKDKRQLPVTLMDRTNSALGN